MSKDEIAKRFCKFELCTHRNGEGMCCLYNQDNCIFHRLEKENHLLGERCTQLLKDKGELIDQIADIKANCDLAIEGRDVKIMELRSENIKLKEKIKELEKYEKQKEWIRDKFRETMQSECEQKDKQIAELKAQIEKMRCCSNCRYKYKSCSWTSESIKDGKITSHYWNKEKQAYCDVGEGAEYQLWEMKEK
ncbi:MAG: hypothetical protein J5710_14015 [Treponema sp.]|nr:hypothetical protein [Treponema sp.]